MVIVHQPLDSPYFSEYSVSHATEINTLLYQTQHRWNPLLWSAVGTLPWAKRHLFMEKSPSKYLIVHYFSLGAYDYRLGSCVSGGTSCWWQLLRERALGIRAIWHQSERWPPKASEIRLKASGPTPRWSTVHQLAPCTANVHRCLVGLRMGVSTDGRGRESERWQSHPLLTSPSLLSYSGILEGVPGMLSRLFKVKQLASWLLGPRITAGTEHR